MKGNVMLTPLFTANFSGPINPANHGPGWYDNWIDGGVGNDVLIGSAAKEVLLAGLENDLLIGGAGNDLLLGDASPKSRRWRRPEGSAKPGDVTRPTANQNLWRNAA